MLEHNFFPASLYSFMLYMTKHTYFSINTEAYSGLSERSKMELFVNIRNYLKPFTIFSSSFILDVWLGSKYASEACFSRVIFNKIDA